MVEKIVNLPAKLIVVSFFFLRVKTSVLFTIILISVIPELFAQNGNSIALNSYIQWLFGSKKVEQNFNNYVEQIETIKIEMIAVEGGHFFMGCAESTGVKCSEDETPQHKVIVDDYYLSKYEITNAQYCVFLNSIGASSQAVHDGKLLIELQKKQSHIVFDKGQFNPLTGKDNYPVVDVSWFGAVAFCKWAGGRLPTEAEWEYAARGGAHSKNYDYSGGNNLDEVGWYFDNSKNDKSSNFYEEHGTFAVGMKKPNELGIYDMTGNVYEWCHDVYDRDYYGYGPVKNPKGPTSGSSRVLRGGSWGDELKSCRLTFRISVGEYTSYFMYGFRFCKSK